ncbi:MAG: DUF1778 domain-containing protein [Thermomicrobiales bacterium]
MPTAPHKKTTSPRLNIRMPQQARAIIDQAASLEGRTTSDFVRASAVEKARETIESHQRIVLSREESIAFAESLLNLSAPSDNTFVDTLATPHDSVND